MTSFKLKFIKIYLSHWFLHIMIEMPRSVFDDLDLDENGESWERGIFSRKSERLSKDSNNQRGIWKALFDKDIDKIRRVLEKAPIAIFTYIDKSKTEVPTEIFRHPVTNGWVSRTIDPIFLVEEKIFEDAMKANVVLKAVELGLYDILDLMITTNPLFVNTCSTVCVY